MCNNQEPQQFITEPSSLKKMWLYQDEKTVFGMYANVWSECFTFFELTEIMRQRDDKKFEKLLNRLREGNHTQNNVEVVKERILKIKPGQ